MQLSHFELFADGFNFGAQTVMQRSAVRLVVRMTELTPRPSRHPAFRCEGCPLLP
jgi:hypothetical protein